jgi:hypothetical protein
VITGCLQANALLLTRSSVENLIAVLPDLMPESPQLCGL